ncbi:MAG: hypothetical protein E6K45_04955 [Gammaproteobacteria bacterium]|nr:MAG: hypothetical protein E6K45_04955 [Gammaproteobacteria bacterium]
MQPGVFALSGWDLVGALTLPAASVRERLADGDTRWINRGAYDLLGSNPQASQSAAGLPRAVALYGSLTEQLQSSDSFASRLARLIRARAQLHLQSARLADVPAVQAKGLFVLVHELPDNTGLEITAINFGDRAIDESVPIRGAATGSKAIDVLEPQAPPLDLGPDGRLQLRLNAFAAKALRIKGPVSP